ncbi:MAG: L-glutamate gamma-semialdehyde dehydrogenase [Syntrophorhabdaceae bacterium]|nr:L-glutamate gamma-semialdehyde dehydrogenase [Syntrophorhabdaceae bacterium]MDD4195730.1 L-glutamate gamma-semialdehyde dehydrogenase [Syntrophorhabdaceae bacterium]
MKNREVNDRIIKDAKIFLEKIRDETLPVFNKERWIGKILDWCMKNDEFKARMFRFVDVFPCLGSGDQIAGHIKEYFGTGDPEIPGLLKWGARSADLGGALGVSLISRAVRHNLKELARQFIVGETMDDVLKNIARLRTEGFAFVLDILGEATVSEDEADRYLMGYLQLLDNLGKGQASWTPMRGRSGDTALDWGYSPRVSISVKPSSFYSQVRPVDFGGSVSAILDRMRVIYKKVIDIGGSLCIDMESYQYKDITLELFRRLRQEYPEYPHLGVALQSYLRDTDKDLDDLLGWVKDHQFPISVRLVKGAYWDYETVKARQNGWVPPVYTMKAESDAAFERQALKIFENCNYVYLACASHNVRSIFAVMETAKELGVPEHCYEFQVLYGMAEPIRKGLLDITGRVRLYCPYGEMVPGMGYLVRRLLENTANECFLRQTFAERVDIERTLEDPEEIVMRARAAKPSRGEKRGPESWTALPFTNEPGADFTKKEQREAFLSAIAEVRKSLGKTYPLFINGVDVETKGRITSINPANPSEVIGHVCASGNHQVIAAIDAAKAAFPAWRELSPVARSEYLIKAAEVTRKRIYELSAWQVLEIGKQWDQAHADVAEAIDFFEYYAREMVRLGKKRTMGSAPGELNHYFYEPKGIASVIAPWNFPLAISCGMTAAAIVAGNCVIYKPSSLTPVIGHHLVEIFRETGLPAGVFNFVPGPSGQIGDILVDHPGISIIAFTGSVEVGLSIIEKAARVHTGQNCVKKVVCEMGGKNAIIIDDDANLDEAVPLVLYSAFGFQGQKCSACSRAIVLDNIYDQFVTRLVGGARSMRIGPAEFPRCALGPVADLDAVRKVTDYIEVGRKEGEIIYMSKVPEGGFYVPITIIGDVRPEHRVAREEIFGPVLSVMRAKDFNEALAWANSTRFALTGGVFSRSPAHLAQARKEFRVGNLYLNRHCTGALVQRQPFGGFRLSGTGTKAGGPDYLLHFMDPRVVSENTMRRGFVPATDDIA